mmetsp:Transcript_34236/g.99404  ORF Transcript_34236/g.99404 Transcript_34236/m.99404 type:complete len:318 (+) Transcript_34236:5975-6928(+)
MVDDASSPSASSPTMPMSTARAAAGVTSSARATRSTRPSPSLGHNMHNKAKHNFVPMSACSPRKIKSRSDTVKVLLIWACCNNATCGSKATTCSTSSADALIIEKYASSVSTISWIIVEACAIKAASPVRSVPRSRNNKPRASNIAFMNAGPPNIRKKARLQRSGGLCPRPCAMSCKHKATKWHSRKYMPVHRCATSAKATPCSKHRWRSLHASCWCSRRARLTSSTARTKWSEANTGCRFEMWRASAGKSTVSSLPRNRRGRDRPSLCLRNSSNKRASTSGSSTPLPVTSRRTARPCSSSKTSASKAAIAPVGTGT